MRDFTHTPTRLRCALFLFLILHISRVVVVAFTCQSSCPSAPQPHWHDLVGVDGKTAKAIIESERSDITVIYVSCVDGNTTEDFCCNRLWLWLDAPTNSNNFELAKVCREPTIG